jgi:hypothetical protein
VRPAIAGPGLATRRGRPAWHWLLLVPLAILGIGQIGYWAVIAKDADKPLDPACASWDREASLGIAALVAEPTLAAESQLDEAFARLRRARQSCRAGWLDVARQDYTQLRELYPFPGRPLVLLR